jgi:hypothetical protein
MAAVEPPLAGCGKSLPLQDVAIGDPQKPQLLAVSPNSKTGMHGFFRRQLDRVVFISAQAVSCSAAHSLEMSWKAFSRMGSL